MPKKLFGKKVKESEWEKAKKLTKEQGFSIKDDKEAFYKYAMGILKQMMSDELEETTVAGDVAVPHGGKKTKYNKKPHKWSDLVKQINNIEKE